VNSLALQSDGKIVAAGQIGVSQFELGRFNVNGSLDTTFNGTGLITTPIGSNSVARGVVIQNDGKIITAGSADNAFAVVRYLAPAPQSGSFTANPNPAAAGSSVTLTASNITDGNPNSSITQVAFYLDSNGDGVLEPGTDTLLGYGTQSGGAWAFPFTAGLAPGSYTLFAQAKDSYGVFGDPYALTLQVV
jgi:uncharacterized delta-60 repeat protein